MTSLAKRTDNDNLISSPDLLYRYSVDIIVAMSALLIAGIYLNGLNALRTAFISVATAAICENIGCRITKRTDRKTHNLYAAATGLAIALMLPAAAPAYVAFAASAFAVIAVLIPFGSARKIPFVPAAAGICFATVCFPEAVFAYSPITIGVSSPVFGSESFISGEAFSKMLTYGESVILNPLETISVLVGKTPGPMGTTCMLVLIGSAVYLLFKRTEGFMISLSFLASCALYAAIFPRVNSGIYTSVTMELSAGMLVFAGLFLLPEPFLAPKKLPGKLAYGFIAGIICMLLRRYGAYEESVCFTVLIMNAFAPAFTDYFEMFTSSLRGKGIIKEKATKFSESKPVKQKKEKVRKEKNIKEKTPKGKKDKQSNNAQSKEADKDEKPRHSDFMTYEELMNFDEYDSTTPEEAEVKEAETDE